MDRMFEFTQLISACQLLRLHTKWCGKCRRAKKARIRENFCPGGFDYVRNIMLHLGRLEWELDYFAHRYLNGY